MEMAKLESLASGVLGYDKSVWYFAILVGFIIILYLNTNSAEEDKSGVAIENEELTVELRSSEESVESVRERKTPNLRSHKSCHQLGNIGRDAYNTKVAGAPLFYITGIISKMLQHDPARRDAAIGTVIAVYGDASLNSGYQAYSAIYDACKQ